jgi:hypothetical protein
MTEMLGDHVSSSSSLGAITVVGSGRVGPTIAALLGLAAAALGARALQRARRPDHATQRGAGRRRPTALLTGLLAVLLGVVFIAAADGGPGTGNGVVGSAFAIVLGTVAVVLDRLATMYENRRADQTAATAADVR